MDFGDDYGAHLWPGVSRPKRRGRLSREMLLAGARHIATEGNAIGLRAEGESVDVARQIRVGVAGEKVNVIAFGTDAEGAPKRIVRIKNDVTVGCDSRSAGNTIFFRAAEIVRQEPSTEIHISAVWIIKLYGIALGRIGVGEDLIDIDRCHVGCARIRRARRSIELSARTPTALEAPGAGGQVFIHDLQGETSPVGARIPAVFVIEVQDWLSEPALEFEMVATVTEAILARVVGVGACDDQAIGVVARAERTDIRHDQAGLPCAEEQIGEIKLDTTPQAKTIHVERSCADILELEVLKIIRVVGIASRRLGRVVHDLGNA